jgi:hypothetical protein
MFDTIDKFKLSFDAVKKVSFCFVIKDLFD